MISDANKMRLWLSRRIDFTSILGLIHGLSLIHIIHGQKNMPGFSPPYADKLKAKSPTKDAFAFMVEHTGIEPVTS